MSIVYEMEGNLIKKVERNTLEVGRITDMLPTLMTYHPVEMGALPKDIVYLKVLPSDAAPDRVEARVIVQQPPQLREILFNESGGPDDTQQAYRLSMPYFNFWFNMQGSPINDAATNQNSFIWTPRSWGIFWTRQPFATTQDEAWAAKMPNSWRDTRVCFGNNPITANTTMGAHINQLINTYWGSVFNTDLDIYLPYPGRTRTALRRWATASTADSDTWRNWDIWHDGGTPIQEVVARVAGYDTFMQPAPDSTEPIVPQPPIQRTWYSIDQWVRDDLTEDQRTRLKEVLDGFTST